MLETFACMFGAFVIGVVVGIVFGDNLL